MLKLNLSDLERSSVRYKILQFPDGQQDLIIESFTDGPVEVQSRFNSFKDLELIICATKALKRLGYKKISLYIPYLLGSRSDRLFQKGGNSYLVDVVAPIINSLQFSKVTTIDVHSDVASACIENLIVKSNFELVDFALRDIAKQEDRPSCLKNVSILSPDAGAEKKIYDLLKLLKYKNDLIVARKHRDVTTGKIVSVEVPKDSIYNNRDIVIVDDICDGGRTFIEIAKVVKEVSPKHCNIYLVITHGIFSNAYKELAEYFTNIYCTNSIKDVGDYHSNELEKTNVKQLKVI